MGSYPRLYLGSRQHWPVLSLRVLNGGQLRERESLDSARTRRLRMP